MTAEKDRSNDVWNVPNVLTMARIVLALVMFALIPFKFYVTALVLFVVAALTDFVDGWWARRFNQKTQFGRIMDPFADKLLVCGTFIYFAAIPELHDVRLFATPENCACPVSKIPFGLATWMVVAIVFREMFVTMLRSMVEAKGGDFSAKWVGKWKTTLQCVALPLGFVYLILWERGGADAIPVALSAAFVVSLYAVVYLTLYSGWIYVKAAMKPVASEAK
ncbi:MAG: CDP-alcohol phosphatidyltransferase family protein [Thermoguttaceae bacterium]|nr:CDP-alcohol phosphatidyltransferase family protein [Thermoguttaceae bacterium]MBQ6827239.1 CDP-alcohol phosphatidyltransferase family protein [Thermoguttaceae bacterium]